MLNKELLMVESEPLEPVLSIYISPDIRNTPAVSGVLSSDKAFYIENTGETTYKFSELDLTAIITVKYYEGAQLSVSNLKPAFASYSGGAERAASAILESFLIKDRTRSASISLV